MKIQYAGWTDAAPQNLSQKDAQKLAKQLKTYVNSTKFIQDGSKINKVNQQGILVKAPVKDVTYYTNAQGADPMSSQQLDDYIRTAVITKDPQMLQRASLYRFYNSKPLVTTKQREKQRATQYKDRLTRNVFMSSVGLGLAGGALPFVQAAIADKYVNSKTLKSAALLALAGIASGSILAGFLTKR